MQPASHPASRYYRPELDVVRFLAFLLVFLHHTLPSGTDPRVIHIFRGFTSVFVALSSACGFGLSLFFTLSAFLICELLLRERESAGAVGIKQFYIRRILRIWPLYYLGLALGLVFLFLPGGHPDQIANFGWFAVFLGAWSLAAQHPFMNPAEVLWSVSVEEQFYVFAPWIVKYFNRKSLYGFCVVLILISGVWLYFLGKVSAIHCRVWYNSFVQYQCFAAGILLCLVLRGRLPRLAIWQRVGLIAFSFSCWFFALYKLHAIFGNRRETDPGSWPLIFGYALGTLGCVLLLVAFLGVIPRLLPRWAIYLGRISFGLYVFHEFAIYTTDHLFIGYIAKFKYLPIVRLLEGPIYVLNMGLTLGLTILLAALSYRFFETPFLKMKKRHSVIESQPIQGVE
jgi:peptidoglycan/LPS O-acetylase OafA/YrhL